MTIKSTGESRWSSRYRRGDHEGRDSDGVGLGSSAALARRDHDRRDSDGVGLRSSTALACLSKYTRVRRLAEGARRNRGWRIRGSTGIRVGRDIVGSNRGVYRGNRRHPLKVGGVAVDVLYGRRHPLKLGNGTIAGTSMLLITAVSNGSIDRSIVDGGRHPLMVGVITWCGMRIEVDHST
jgi:hypothetical protein